VSDISGQRVVVRQGVLSFLPDCNVTGFYFVPYFKEIFKETYLLGCLYPVVHQEI